MIKIILNSGTTYEAIEVKRRSELSNPTMVPVAFFIEVELKDKRIEIPYTSISEIIYE